ncbi:hypothetical protein [Nonomuraea sp. NPDC050310]|uniref:hypothetical protein n=1 Tax=Nonomuraea sp. NPDC050310 TaxID=3154935 RepID=UPI0033C19383
MKSLPLLTHCSPAARRSRFFWTIHKKGASAKKIAVDEARVAKERRDLATATEKLSATTVAYKKSSLTPAARLGASLALGVKNTAAFIKNTATFIKNLETIAAKGFPELAQQLLAMGGADAENTRPAPPS